MLLFVKELISSNKLNDFIRIRAKFEEVVYTYSFIVQQIIRKYRQTKRSYDKIANYFSDLMNIISANPGKASELIINELRNLPDYKYLQTEIIDNEEVDIRSNFSRGKRQQIKLQTFVSNLPKCPICGGYLDNYSISVDHIVRKADGGDNSKANGQVTHLYCNTTYKN